MHYASDLIQRLVDALPDFDLDSGGSPYEFTGTLGGEEPLQVVVAREVVLPPSWSFLFGDIVHNVRSTLDNLVWALSVEHLGGSGEPSKQTAFPILKKKREWAEEADRKLPDVSPEVRSWAESHQPFQCLNPLNEPGGIPPARQLLARLAEYSNANKHRVPPLLAGMAATESFDFVEMVDCSVVSTTHPEGFVPLRRGTVLATVEVAVTGPAPQLSTSGTTKWFPVLENGENVHYFSAMAMSYVTDMVYEARQFFAGAEHDILRDGPFFKRHRSSATRHD